MPNGWQTPYGTVSRAGDYSEWRRRMAAQRPPLAYGQPGATVDRGQFQGWYPSPWQVPIAEAARRMIDEPLTEYWGLPPTAAVGGGAPPISAGVPLGSRTAPVGAPWTIPGGPPILPPAATPGGVGEGLEYFNTALGALGPGQAGAPVGAVPPGYPTGMRPPALGVAPGLYPPGAGAPTGAGARAGAGGGAGAGARGGTPTATGAFGPFGSIEEWRNQFYAEHGRWPNDTDAQDAIASFGFLAQTGRSPTQQEWEGRWYGGYGGTPQWGPVGYGGGGGGGGWQPPPQPSWWGGEVLGKEGWTYLPTEMGKWPDQPPERLGPDFDYGTAGQTGGKWGKVGGNQEDWYDIKTMRSFQQVPPQWRDWLQQVMQSQQQYWENPLMAPIQWAQPAQSEL